MVGIALVSHSAVLVEGLLKFIKQMAPPTARIAVAGGVSDAENPFGTDPFAIKDAISEVADPDGVLVLIDLGSALMSAEVAVELLREEGFKAPISLCPAPLVEGGVAAVMRAALGSDLQEVEKEAMAAIGVKAAHLNIENDANKKISSPATGKAEMANSPVSNNDYPLFEQSITIKNPLGLHARPAANLIKKSAVFSSTIWLEKNSRRAEASALNQIMLLGVKGGETIRFLAQGSDAQEALLALAEYADAFFDEPESERKRHLAYLRKPSDVKVGLIDQNRFTGQSLDERLIAGVCATFTACLPPVDSDQSPAEPRVEESRFFSALESVVADLSQADRQLAALAEIHALILNDASLKQEVVKEIGNQVSAESAWMTCVRRLFEEYQNSTSPIIAQRAADVLDVGLLVHGKLTGKPPVLPQFETGAVVVARGLTPSAAAALAEKKVGAVCLVDIGLFAHAAIVLRMLGVPTLAGVDSRAYGSAQGSRRAVLDCRAGVLVLDPEKSLYDKKFQIMLKEEANRKKTREHRWSPGVTGDGYLRPVLANIGRAREAADAVEAGAEGVGLLRSEFIFFENARIPDQEAQYMAYRQAAQALNGRPLTIRTLDAGADKPVTGLSSNDEANPALGCRGLRLLLKNQSVFKQQLKAILRLAGEYPTRLLHPMVTTLAEWQQAEEILARTTDELKEAGFEVTINALKRGAMIEVPAMILRIDDFAEACDFFSIGTNDLTQYLMAADRENNRLTDLNDPFQPAVLRAVAKVAEVAAKADRPIAVCGELASHRWGAALLIGLGVGELSVNPAAIAEVKQVLRSYSLDHFQAAARAAMEQKDAAAVRLLSRDFLISDD